MKPMDLTEGFVDLPRFFHLCEAKLAVRYLVIHFVQAKYA